MKTTQKTILLIATLLLIVSTGFALTWFRSHQKLGKPGLKATPIPDSVVMKIELPEKVLDFTSTNIPPAEVVTNYLPRDTSYAQRRYEAPDGFWVSGNVILMGSDRSSIHRPEYCLPGQGWQIRSQSEEQLTISKPSPYQISIAKWTLLTKEKLPDGTQRDVAGLYVFWYVADNEQTPRTKDRMWWTTRDLLTSGVLQRWAYVSFFTACLPGQEDAAFERIKSLIAASVPEFQLPPSSVQATAMVQH